MTLDDEHIQEHGSTRIPRPRRRIIRLAVGFLIAGAGLTLVNFVAQPSSFSEEAVVHVSGDAFSVLVGGNTITATNALFRVDTPGVVVKGECSEDLDGLLDEGRLTHDVLVVKSSVGVACIPRGATQTIGNVDVTARELALVATDGKGNVYRHPDAGGAPIYFRELGIRAHASAWQQLQNMAAGVLLAIGATLLVEGWKMTDWWRRRSARGTRDTE